MRSSVFSCLSPVDLEPYGAVHVRKRQSSSEGEAPEYRCSSGCRRGDILPPDLPAVF